MWIPAPPGAAGLWAHHVRQLDVGQAVDEGLAEVGELMQQRVVLLLHGLVLLLHGLQVGLHGGDLQDNKDFSYLEPGEGERKACC